MKKIRFNEFNEFVSKDAELKAKIESVPNDELRFNRLSDIVESLGYELLPDEEDEIMNLTDEELDSVAGGALCNHDYKFQWKEITDNGILRMHYKCRKCRMPMTRSTRIK